MEDTDPFLIYEQMQREAELLEDEITQLRTTQRHREMVLSNPQVVDSLSAREMQILVDSYQDDKVRLASLERRLNTIQNTSLEDLLGQHQAESEPVSESDEGEYEDTGFNDVSDSDSDEGIGPIGGSLVRPFHLKPGTFY